MDNSPVGLLTDQFAKLTDPRTGHAKRNKLIDVIVIAICAVICGADSWVDVDPYQPYMVCRNQQRNYPM